MKALEAAKEKGRQAARNGLPRLAPYNDGRTHYGGVTFSRAFIRAWEAGYDEEKNKS